LLKEDEELRLMLQNDVDDASNLLRVDYIVMRILFHEVIWFEGVDMRSGRPP
jgi:hypothetical protein